MKGLKRWFAEEWKTSDDEECGSFNKKGKRDGKCRPSKRITSDTPATWGELTESQKKRAISDKNKASKQGKQYSKVRFSKLKKTMKKEK
jgi:hypothetical protein